MARWKLLTPHYLNTVSSNEWEYMETDRSTGRPIRKKFTVPRYLHPMDPGDWTRRWGTKGDEEGEVVVCHGTSSDAIEFIGDPTPDMLPLDDEARAISSGLEHIWQYRPDTDIPGDYSQSLVDAFQTQMAEVVARPVEVPGMTDLVTAIGSLVTTLAAQQPSPSLLRRS